MRKIVAGLVLCLMLCTSAFAQDGQKDSAAAAAGSLPVAGDKAPDKNGDGKGEPEEQDQKKPDNAGIDEEEIYELDTVEVVGRKPEAGKTRLSREQLDAIPMGSAGMTEALKVLPNVQFDTGFNSSERGGEIVPPQISIGGAEPYQNQYQIDGISINNRLSPRSMKENTSPAIDRLYGEPTLFFFDADLLDSIEVYTSNVPAEKGGFLGGVVSGELKDPRMDGLHGSLKYRHTRSNWLSTKVEDEQAFHESQDTRNQPRFSRHDAFISLEGPINDKLGALLTFGQKYSRIPLDSVYGEQVQYRRNTNLMGQLMWTPEDDTTVKFALGYAPYEHNMFLKTAVDSGFTITGGGLFTTASLDRNTEFGTLKSSVGFTSSELSRSDDDGEDSFYKWLNTGTMDWHQDPSYADGGDKYASEGGWGELEMHQKMLEISSSIAFNPVQLGWWEHSFSTGFEFMNTTADSSNSGYTSYTSAKAPADPSGLVGDKSDGVITGEQYASFKSIFPEYSRSMTINEFAAFIQDEFKFSHFTFRPGLRFSFDDFTENLDIAYRLKLDYDLLDNGDYILTFGANRYYGQQLLTNALHSRPKNKGFRRTYDESTGTLSDWAPSGFPRPDPRYALAELDTPYSDELSLGFNANLWYGVKLNMEINNRQSEKQLRLLKVKNNTPEGTQYTYEYTNEGSSTYLGLTGSLSKSFETSWGSHSLNLGVSYSERETDFKDNMLFVGTDFEEPGYDEVFYNGELIDRTELPATNYNSPWVVTLSYSGKFYEDRLRLGTSARYQSATDVIEQEKDDIAGPDGVEHESYRDATRGDGVIVDASIEYDVLRYEDHTFTLLFDVDNVFNTFRESSESGSWSKGRQLYAGFKYSF